MNKSKVVLFFLLFLTFAVAVMAEEPKGAKALFYSGEGTEISSWDKSASKKVEKKLSISKYMGIEYWIDREGVDGKISRVSTKHVFHSGERFKLSLKSNTNGYLYVLNFGSSGNTNVLFPRTNTADNYIRAFEPYSIPYNSFLKFDATPGEETILVMLSPQPITDIPTTSPESKTTYAQYTSFTSNAGAKDILLEDDIISITPSTHAKDIVVEDTSGSLATPVQYAIAPIKALGSGKVIPVYIKIRHQ